MKVFVPGPLRPYTNQANVVHAEGGTVGELFQHLDSKYPGIRFRIIDEQDQVREHIKIFVNEEQQGDLVGTLNPSDEIQIICALSGGSGG